jgi:hypothetical protein
MTPADARRPISKTDELWRTPMNHTKRIPTDRVSISGLASAALLAAFLGCSSISPAEHYKRFQDWESLHIVLSEQIKPGDPIEAVQSLLGTNTYASAYHRGGLETSVRAHPHDFPDGLKDSDVILLYPKDNQELVPLIFRNGKLVNYDPNKYLLPK